MIQHDKYYGYSCESYELDSPGRGHRDVRGGNFTIFTGISVLEEGEERIAPTGTAQLGNN